MARKKCYFCEERFDEDWTTLASFKVGGNYRTANAWRPVRACYRCVASKRYRTTFQNCTDDDKVAGMAKRGWTIPVDWNEHKWGWGVFDLLWPDGDYGPLDPSTIPERLVPPPLETP